MTYIKRIIVPQKIKISQKNFSKNKMIEKASYYITEWGPLDVTHIYDRDGNPLQTIHHDAGKGPVNIKVNKYLKSLLDPSESLDIKGMRPHSVKISSGIKGRWLMLKDKNGNTMRKIHHCPKFINTLDGVITLASKNNYLKLDMKWVKNNNVIFECNKSNPAPWYLRWIFN